MTLRPRPILLAALVAFALQPAACAKSQPANLPAPDRQAPASAAQMRLSFSPVVKRAAPAVVNVYSKRVVRTQIDPFWGMFMGGGGVPQERVAQSLGSGSIVRADGVILTNHHVIAGAQEIIVVTSDRRE